MLRTTICLLTALMLADPAGAEDLSGPQVSHFTLQNGLELVVIPDRRAPIVTHMIWYKVGAADDPAGQSGVAHFLEHLMFKGTPTYPADSLDRLVGELGGNINAFTTADATAYFETIPPDALDEVMVIEADRMRNLDLPATVIDAERAVVLDERRQRIDASPGSILAEELRATLFQNHPYRIPSIGWEHEIADLSREDALEFYGRFYAPNNAVVVVAGDVDVDAVRTLADEIYGKLQRGPALPERARAAEPPQDTSRTVSYSDARVTLPSFSRSWIVPGYRVARSGEAEALDVLASVLSDGLRARLYQNLVVKTGIAAQAGAGYDGSVYDDGTFSLYGTPKPGKTLSEVEAAVYAEIDDIIANGITNAELARVKKRLVRSTVLARDDQGTMARIYGSTLTVGQSMEDLADWPGRIGAVTTKEVQAVAAKYLRPAIAVTGYLQPAEESQK